MLSKERQELATSNELLEPACKKDCNEWLDPLGKEWSVQTSKEQPEVLSKEQADPSSKEWDGEINEEQQDPISK
jgi:hypothetical protein